MPDLFNGDSVEEWQLNSPTFDIAGWLARHAEETWKPIVDGVVAATSAGVPTCTTRYGLGMSTSALSIGTRPGPNSGESVLAG